MAVIAHAIHEGNYKRLLALLLDEADFLLNLSADVSRLALIALCCQRRALYLDSGKEPWHGRYDNPALLPSQRSNYALREEVLALPRRAVPAQRAS